MQDVTHPHHPHEHRVWVVPDSTLGRWAAFVFTVATVVAVAAPLVAWVTQHLVATRSRHPVVLRRCGVRRSSALVVATGAGSGRRRRAGARPRRCSCWPRSPSRRSASQRWSPRTVC